MLKASGHSPQKINFPIYNDSQVFSTMDLLQANCIESGGIDDDVQSDWDTLTSANASCLKDLRAGFRKVTYGGGTVQWRCLKNNIA
jgi:hypothetical protein